MYGFVYFFVMVIVFIGFIFYVLYVSVSIMFIIEKVEICISNKVWIIYFMLYLLEDIEWYYEEVYDMD